ncbi:FAA hydrolase family protein [Aliishimia ponticola]|uniref:FAA hydrolase family protein n=1 Tax=Aliishimia ponticola TaxID=2499833 RepID=A0A4S4NE41_9RHOB|nr:fumarylacetoacetate hydrolase family protein [Aliishimia ponticola]THH37015.1 FAA hydrolase family protein [Aliishimia ponticola]
MTLVFAAAPTFTVPLADGSGEFPVRRIFCVGRNYVAHAVEMGGEVDREAPWYFTKTPVNGVRSGAVVPFPQGTENYHHEMELAVYIGAEAFQTPVDQAHLAVFGFSCALDMTRRDRQQDGKDHRRPWDLGKDVENGSVLAPISREWNVTDTARIHLEVNGETRQDATLAELVWTVDEVISHLSHYYRLQPGDVIMTGTPAGVGAVVAGDKITGGIDGLPPIALTLSDPE